MEAKSRRAAGSPQAGGPAFLAVGRFRRPHGVRGEILIEVLTDFPERLQPGTVVYAGETHRRLVIRSRRGHQEGLLLAFAGLETPEAAGQLRHQFLYVTAADRPPLPEGEYYHHQLLGLTVQTETGRRLGTLTDILETGANDVYVVTPDKGREILLPVIPGVILDVNLEAGTMRVRLPDGLLDEENGRP
ncbi:MAG: ribosome maturation factor RimM [Anaerolineales bacterium]